jgi:micrococcal nuclease
MPCAKSCPPIGASSKQKPSKQAEQQKGGEQSDAAGSDKGNATAEELHPPVTVKITRVVDGDTIEISPSVDGKDTVRLIGIDAPEEASSGCRAQPLAQDATDQASLWEGQRVKLEFDKDRTDQYGRLLAYVPDPMTRSMMNVEMIKEGYAQVYIVPPNTKHEAELRKAQAEAKDMAEAMGVNLGLSIWDLPPAKDKLLTDHGNGIGQGDGACPPKQQSATPAAASPSPSPNPSPNRDYNAPNPNAPDNAPSSASPGSASPGAGGGGSCPQGGHWVGPNGPGDGDGDGCAGE